MRLNKYLSQSGAGTRRETTDLIKKGLIHVNGMKIIDPAVELKEGDEVTYNGKTVKPLIKYEYWVMNKSSKLPLLSQDDLSVEKILKTKSGTALKSIGDISDASCGLVVMTNDPFIIDIYSNSQHKAKSQFAISLSNVMDKKTFDNLKSNRSKLLSYGIMNLIQDVNEKTKPTTLILETIGVSDAKVYQFLSDYNIHHIKVDREWFNGISKKDLKRGWSRPLSEKEKVFLLHFSPTNQEAK
ncbi:MAG: S4 domain-containing protein [Saprospiraceae bacterium]